MSQLDQGTTPPPRALAYTRDRFCQLLSSPLFRLTNHRIISSISYTSPPSIGNNVQTGISLFLRLYDSNLTRSNSEHEMAASIYPDYPPKITPEQHEFLLSNIKDWSILNGLAVRPSHAFVPTDVDPSGSIAVTAPVTIFPSLFPRSCFDEARKIQQAYNELYSSISRDRAWLKKIVEEYVFSCPYPPNNFPVIMNFPSAALRVSNWAAYPNVSNAD